MFKLTRLSLHEAEACDRNSQRMLLCHQRGHQAQELSAAEGWTKFTLSAFVHARRSWSYHPTNSKHFEQMLQAIGRPRGHQVHTSTKNLSHRY